MGKNKILLVDDEEVTAMAEAAQLGKHDFKTKTLHNSQDAIDYIDENDDIDLILMDIELNDERDGIETAQIIHEDHDIPILFLTAHEEPDFLNRVKQTVAYNYLLKGTSGAMIANAIQQALKLHKAQQQIKRQNEQLRQEEEQYRKIVESSQAAMAILKNDEVFFINKSFTKLTEYDREYLLGESISDLALFDKIAEVVQALQVQKDETEQEFEFEMQTASKEVRYVSVRILKIEIQFEPAFFLTLYDRTEQKELLQKIDKARQITDELGNFIPICAGCKKIRDEDKEGNPWIEPEQYISERLPDIQFSHGICPDCVEDLYPEYSKKKKQEE
ncbi:MAG TPA: response regulator [bacterium]|nr:response regulator [bacterium]